jgi:EAL domain-containing protein (putative c-di-GMP-specific phosphodiesterase class I)
VKNWAAPSRQTVEPLGDNISGIALAKTRRSTRLLRGLAMAQRRGNGMAATVAPRDFGPMSRRFWRWAILAVAGLALLFWQIGIPLVAILTLAGTIGLLSVALFFDSRAHIDTGTELPNRRAMVLAAQLAPPQMVVVALVDRFQAIATGFGAEAGERLVRKVAERLRLANVERLIYRIDEASLAWMETAGEQITMEDRLEAVVAVMRSPVDCGLQVDVALTLGIAEAADETLEQLLANASAAALRAAGSGLRWERFRSDCDQEADWHLSLVGELDAAMASGQVWNSYQPRLDIATGSIIGAEALVRWLHPERGPIAPDDFIPLLEEHGRAGDLTFHVLVRALEDAAQWERSGRPVGVSINLSAALFAEEEFIEQIRQVLNHCPVPPDRLTIEVSEAAVMRNAQRAIAALASWRSIGINVAIDDYGTAGLPLDCLQNLPAAELKIDRSFVQTIDTDERNAFMVRSSIELAHDLGMKAAAEGVESDTCLQILRELGCDHGQGFYIGRPMSAANLSVFLGGNTRDAA